MGPTHLPYSPDIAPSDYHLFRSMARGLDEQHFHSYEDVKKWVDSWIASKDVSFFQCGIKMLPEGTPRSPIARWPTEDVTLSLYHGGRSCLVVRLRLWGRRTPSSNPDSTEDQLCIAPVACYPIRRESNVFPLHSGPVSFRRYDFCLARKRNWTTVRWCGAGAWRRRASLGDVLVI
ncbi:hypothetical protein AVEN_212450-1 [Araneus ventricosus]|uniref:Mariner Mos1 transposase n=1 Tax=Araneus ventricosus TaxID=182803 RepID=A0A4Y2MTV4_ARAVE|nr:hypothetical protein AVEN_212450-1 [Araneus ventricosus]